MIKDSIKKSIDLEPLKLCCEDGLLSLMILLRKVLIWDLWSSVVRWLTLLKDSISEFDDLVPVELCCHMVELSSHGSNTIANFFVNIGSMQSECYSDSGR